MEPDATGQNAMHIAVGVHLHDYHFVNSYHGCLGLGLVVLGADFVTEDAYLPGLSLIQDAACPPL